MNFSEYVDSLLTSAVFTEADDDKDKKKKKDDKSHLFF